jgi:hypothetical protein
MAMSPVRRERSGSLAGERRKTIDPFGCGEIMEGQWATQHVEQAASRWREAEIPANEACSPVISRKVANHPQAPLSPVAPPTTRVPYCGLMSTPTAGWENFFVAQVGAAAALSGLVFVAVSTSLPRIVANKHLRGRAPEVEIQR